MLEIDIHSAEWEGAMYEFPFQELVYATRWYYRTSGTGGMAFLALQIYRRPMEMMYAVLRLAMLLADLVRRPVTSKVYLCITTALVGLVLFSSLSMAWAAPPR